MIVTGGNRGIGRAIVERFVAAGHKVASLDMGGEPPEGAVGFACNVTDAAQVDEAFAAAEAANGPVEILVANAGITKDTLILRMGDAEWDAVINVNLTGAFRCAKRATKSMIRGRWGRIIFTGSVVGLYGSAGQVNYSALQGCAGRHGPLAHPRDRYARRDRERGCPRFHRDRHDGCPR